MRIRSGQLRSKASEMGLRQSKSSTGSGHLGDRKMLF